MKKIILVIFGCIAFLQSQAITRVILSTNDHPDYIQFWPLVAQFWRDVVGARPTLAYINEQNAPLDASLGDIIKFKPIPGVPTSVHAQTIRLLLPTLFPDDICITSDIDMIPLQKNYFTDPLKDLKSGEFVVYRRDAYGEDQKRFPMCYFAAHGSTFKDIFNKDSRPLDEVIRSWFAHRQGWSTDEYMATKLIHEWPKFDTHCVLLKNTINAENRVDRSNWQYDKKRLRERFYVDSHMLRSYEKHKERIDQLVRDFRA